MPYALAGYLLKTVMQQFYLHHKPERLVSLSLQARMMPNKSLHISQQFYIFVLPITVAKAILPQYSSNNMINLCISSKHLSNLTTCVNNALFL